MSAAKMIKLSVGDVIQPRDLMTIQGDQVTVPDAERLVHLQFRRYAGCPICNLHLRSISRRHQEIAAVGVREVVVFHSTTQTMLEFQGELPFAAIADPEKHLYREFGVGTSLRSILSPRTWLTSMTAPPMVFRRGIIAGPRKAWGTGEHHLGLPADFLIEPSGRIMEAKYGRYADDQWSVDEVLALAGAAARPASRLRGAVAEIAS